jgi:hypothetical protein
LGSMLSTTAVTLTTKRTATATMTALRHDHDATAVSLTSSCTAQEVRVAVNAGSAGDTVELVDTALSTGRLLAPEACDLFARHFALLRFSVVSRSTSKTMGIPLTYRLHDVPKTCKLLVHVFQMQLALCKQSGFATLIPGPLCDGTSPCGLGSGRAKHGTLWDLTGP